MKSHFSPADTDSRKKRTVRGSRHRARRTLLVPVALGLGDNVEWRIMGGDLGSLFGGFCIGDDFR
jgi:hypothetical protein